MSNAERTEETKQAGLGKAIMDRLPKFGGNSNPDVDVFPGEVDGSLVCGKQEPGVETDSQNEAKSANKYIYADTAPLIEELKHIKAKKGDSSTHVKEIVGELELIEGKRKKEKKSVDNASHSEQAEDIKSKPEGDDSDGKDTPYLFGIGLSGGGIRAATFSLGVLQRLVEAGILKHTDYLSTVSGGGYIGSALAWWLNGKNSRYNSGNGQKHGVDKENFPFGISDPANPQITETPILRFLRRNGNYLTPGDGINVISGLTVVFRAIFLNLLVWIPLVTTVFLLIKWALAGNYSCQSSAPLATFEICETNFPLFAFFIQAAIFLIGIFFLFSIAYSLLSWSSRKNKTEKKKSSVAPKIVITTQKTNSEPEDFLSWLRKRKIAAVWIVLNLGLVILSILFAYWTVIFESKGMIVANNTVYKIANNAWEEISSTYYWFVELVRAIFSAGTPSFPSEIKFIFLFTAVVVAGMAANYYLNKKVRENLKHKHISERYSGRREFEVFFGRVFIAIGILLLFGSVPYAHEYIDGKFNEAGPLGIIGGIASAFWGFLQSRGKGGGSKYTSLILTIGSIAFAYGLLLVGFSLSEFVYEEFKAGNAYLITAFGILIIIALISGWFTNLNYISLGRFYRDRLMEAFMPDIETVSAASSGPASRADELKMADLWERGDNIPVVGPYPIINTNAVLVNSKTRKYAMRGGDNFALTPLLCGGNATGWTPTRTFDSGELTLASAMATSGAAANPRGGVGGKGVTMNRFVSFVMTMLNFRLGYWVNRPQKKRLQWWRRRPSHFYPSSIYSIPGRGYKEDSTFLELSDGGHFENLAIYELIRRRCGLIMICDGGQDATASYSDFVTAVQRIGEDFGAKIEFKNKNELDKLVPQEGPSKFPKDAEYADKGYFVATINYGNRGGGAWPKKGLLIYMKTTMINGLSFSTKGYKGANPGFPDQSTADQFFDEEQFEAYRDVGYQIADQVITGSKFGEVFSGGDRPVLEKLLEIDKKEDIKIGEHLQGS